MNTSFLTIYSGELKSILKDVLEKSEIHEWLYEREKEEFEDIVDSVLKKIK